jgi:hypothetical protein
MVEMREEDKDTKGRKDREISKNYSCRIRGSLGYYAMQSAESQPMFRKNMSLQSSGLKSKPNEKPVMACCLFHAGFMHGFLFSPEDRGNIFLGNVG